ncbi:MAG: histidine phosphatase family protein [Planctomycetaceae bacterium]
MKTLLLLRHAKSSWDDSSLEDYDRPLNKRGKKAAPKMGYVILEENILPDAIITSPARRARETAFLVAEECGFGGAIEVDLALYPTSSASCIDVLSNLSEDIDTVLLVAHNPGLEQLVESLTGTYERLPTAALVQLCLEIDDWTDLTGSTPATLLNLWRPRELF